jgi:hypothetical protein
MICRHTYVLLLALIVYFGVPCAAQYPEGPSRITPVMTAHSDGTEAAELEIYLRAGANAMEPTAEPRRIRIDDRAFVTFRLYNLSPLDVCTRNVSAPTANAETSPAESLVTTIAGLPGAGAGFALAELPQKMSQASALSQSLTRPSVPTPVVKPPDCNVQKDPEYENLKKLSDVFLRNAGALIGTPPVRDQPCNFGEADKDQAELACELDAYGRRVAGYPAGDFRWTKDSEFRVAANPQFDAIRDAYANPITTIERAGRLKAATDEIALRAADLHKKYDYTANAPDSGAAPAAPPIVPGALTVAPLALTFAPASTTQIVQISSGGQAAPFTATAASDTGWLRISKAGSSAAASLTLTDAAPTRGFYDVLVTADPTGLTGTHLGTITIVGTGAAAGTTIVNVKFSPPSGPTECDLKALAEVDDILDRANAVLSLIGDNNKTLESGQATLKTAYLAMLKIEDDFKRRLMLGVVHQDQTVVDHVPHTILYQDFQLGTDWKNNDTGYFACVTDVDGKTATTTNIYYTLLYQDVPHWSASAGLLTSFLGKRVIGLTDQYAPPTPATPATLTMPATPGTPNSNSIFAITGQARVQVFPMAFLNYRFLPYLTTHYGRGRESELVWTTNLSAGIGVNPNTGTNQPEFFAGLALGLNHLMLHPGIHFGRTENLTGGFAFNTPLASTVSTVPLNWGYHMAFSIGFSVRVAPY